MKFTKFLISILTLCTIINSAPANAQPVFPEPPNGYVLDEANILNVDIINDLNNKLKGVEDTNSVEIAVVTIESLQDYDIAEFSLELGREWGVGQKESNNGLLFVIAPNERKVRIEVGYGLEGAIPDIMAHQIIENIIIPEFKKNNYQTGIINGVEAISKLALGEEFIIPKESFSEKFMAFFLDGGFQVVIILGWMFFSYMRHTKSWWAGGFAGAIVGALSYGFIGIISGIVIGLFIDYILSTIFFKKYVPGPGGGGFGIGGGSSGGSSSSSFGGGSFGGGGSSGSW